ncbi:hypothetical protein SCLCIDRAFT_1222761 [Scleroderma citrinum Foug A]|uniref:Uncharacterized protein n=1 Tax=Scleroderma citrinum Foug A TaxID=1036808 RepID=A0A0C3DAN4_9AGAM|nr:hypothetical protein SCLCIDRAFT_1222761 [Scleroderma citrinum Foug A]
MCLSNTVEAYYVLPSALFPPPSLSPPSRGSAGSPAVHRQNCPTRANGAARHWSQRSRDWQSGSFLDGDHS